MIWKAIALFGAGSFFVVGLGVLTNPLCNSVSFRGGGARTVLTTCYPDSSGDFSKLSAVAGSWLIGLAILGILFWPTLKVLFSNYQFKQKLSQATQEYNNQQVLPEGENKAQDETSNQTHPQFANLTKIIFDNKLIAGVLVVVLLLGFYKVAAPKISLLNPITCSSLKKELAKIDVVGRQIWESYQLEVSSLSQIEPYSDYYYMQVANAARRAKQLNINDAQRFLLMIGKPHCVKDVEALKIRVESIKTILDYLDGVRNVEGKIFTVENGWNSGYYPMYFGSESFLR
jgi:hypothetical protein